MRVGFIGLGMMGKGMAANLQKAGHELVVHDLSRAAAEPFLAKGAVWANSPKQIAEQTEVIFTSLPVPADVEQVALGPNGLIEGMRPDTVFFDMSTNSVAVVRKINAAFAEKNLYMLDSPVSGGPSGAASGKMAIRVGGDEQQFNRHKPVLDAMGDQAAYIGPIGAGPDCKISGGLAATNSSVKSALPPVREPRHSDGACPRLFGLLSGPAAGAARW